MILASLLVLTLTASPAREQAPLSETQRETAVLALQDLGDGSTVIDPILILRNGAIQSIPNQCELSPELTAFDTKYLKPGNKYQMIFGGARVGTATVIPPEPPNLLVQVEGPIKPSGFTKALAVNSPTMGRKTSSRRRLAEPEAASATDFVKELLVQNGVTPGALTRLRMVNLTLTDVEADGTTELIGSAVVAREDGMGLEHSLFFVASRNGAKYIPSLVWYDRPKTALEGQMITLVDHLDLDGDGVDELVTEIVFYENYRYQVYSKANGEWQRIFETQILGCM